MAQEYAEVEEPKDRTKLLWAAVVGLIILMLAALWISSGRRDRATSYVRAKHILIPYSADDPVERSRALEQVLELRERILGGESFERLAREYSGDPLSAPRGGHLDSAPRQTYAEAFENYVWTAPVGQLSEVITTVHGFHLVVVTDRYISKAEAYEAELDQRAREVLREGAGLEREDEGEAPAP